MTTEPASPDPYAAVPVPPAASAAAGEPRADVGPDGRRRPRWAPWTSVVALIAGLAAALFGALVIGAVALAFGADFKHQPPSVTIAATIVQDLCLIGAAILFARFTGRVSPGDFGLRSTRLLPAIGWAVLAWTSFYVFTAAFIAIIGANPHDDQLPKELGADESTPALLAGAVLPDGGGAGAGGGFFFGRFFRPRGPPRGAWGG